MVNSLGGCGRPVTRKQIGKAVKAFAAIFLVLALALSISGCGGGADQPQSPGLSGNPTPDLQAIIGAAVAAGITAASTPAPPPHPNSRLLNYTRIT